MGKFQLDTRVAFVTGAASGIGRAIAVSLAKRGAKVALGDINRAGLDETAELVKAAGAPPTVHYGDITSSDYTAAIASEIDAEYGQLDILVNNAGVDLLGSFNDCTADDFEWVINVNLIAMMRLTKVFMPILAEAPEARIVNLSSVFGIVARPRQAAYCASKFAVRGFSESLRHDLRKTKIGVTVVHPGGVNTRLVTDARVPSAMPKEDAELAKTRSAAVLTKPPESVAEIIVSAIEKRKRRVIIGADARFLVFLEKLFPVSYWPIVRNLTFWM